MASKTPLGRGQADIHDPLFDALSDPRRRSALRVLRHQQEVCLTELAEMIVDAETENPRQAITEPTISEIETSLYHSHVPKLVDVGLLHYAEPSDEVALSDRGAAVVNGLDAFLRTYRMDARKRAFSDT